MKYFSNLIFYFEVQTTDSWTKVCKAIKNNFRSNQCYASFLFLTIFHILKCPLVVCQIFRKLGYDASVCFHFLWISTKSWRKRGGRTYFRGRGWRYPSFLLKVEEVFMENFLEKWLRLVKLWEKTETMYASLWASWKIQDM